MRNSKKAVTKDDTISRKDKKKDTAPTTITSTERSTGTKRGKPGPPKTGTRSQTNTEKKSGINPAAAPRVKKNPQTGEKFTTKKNKVL